MLNKFFKNGRIYFVARMQRSGIREGATQNRMLFPYSAALHTGYIKAISPILKNIQKVIIYLIFSCLTINCFAAKPIQLIFWHAMAGPLGDATNKIISEFNHSQNQYHIKPIYKGSYNEVLTSLVAAFRAHKPPAIVQVFEVGTAMMLYPKGIVAPVYQLMQDNHLKFDSHEFIPAIQSYYSDKAGRLMAMPFNSSTPVLYYNKQAFKKAHIKHIPQTWAQIAITSKQLLQAGIRCGFTSAWPSWIQLEAYSAIQNLPFASRHNGFAGADAKLLFVTPAIIKHVQQLKAWQAKNIFQYGGREDNALSLFTSGQCAMLMQSSGVYRGLQETVKFPVGIAALPYQPGPGLPTSALIGGGALWAMQRLPQQDYRGIALFFQFLARPEVQAEWQSLTGYLPVTKKAYQLSLAKGFYHHYPDAKVAIEQLNSRPQGQNSQGLRLGNYPQIRELNNQALEAVWSGQTEAKQALTHAANKGNRLLQEFAENVR